MEPVIAMRDVGKSYGKTRALEGINLEIGQGRIVGLIGPNGAGKSTLLKALTGGITYDGAIEVLGYEPHRMRHKVMLETGVIHDVSVLPPWMKVEHLIDYMDGVNAGFSRESCEKFLASTSIELHKKVRQLSKGMKTQLHLAMVLATQSRLLILDEPTHGLDILFRKRLYSSVLEDYYDGEKTVVISTHQVEEVEHILSDVIFLGEGKLLLYCTMEELHAEFVQVTSSGENAAAVRALGPLTEHDIFGKKVFVMRGVDRATVEPLGELQVPTVADIFVALMGGVA
ncbi:MAG: ABC transporter ATP-binding protein [Candidatus Marinimicrobia bacterium]|nr:ABC transporter ATP-binding protein [Candidatus Neomarinimicrobiota bacterium]